MSYTPSYPGYRMKFCSLRSDRIAMLTASVRDIIHHKEDFNRADSQLTLYPLLWTKARGQPEEARLQEKVEMSKMICKNAAADTAQTSWSGRTPKTPSSR